MIIDNEARPKWWKVGLPLLVMIASCAAAVGLFTLSIVAIVRSGADPRWAHAAAFVFGIVILCIALVGAKAMQKATRAMPSAAMQRYNRRVQVAMALYVVCLVAAMAVFRELQPSGPLAYCVALAPSLPLVAVVAAMAFYLREETDEFLRVLMLHSALVATGLLLVVATVWGFLEMFELVPHAPGWVAFPLWAIGLGAGRGFLASRYR